MSLRTMLRYLFNLVIIGLLSACSWIGANSSETPATGVPGDYPAPPATFSPGDVVTSPTGTPHQVPAPADWEPQPGDEALEKGQAFVDDSQILVLESFPPQYRLTLKGNLPTPCHSLRVRVPPPDDQKRILVEVYSIFDPAEMCIQVLKAFEVSIPLNPTPGETFTILVNGKLVGEISQ